MDSVAGARSRRLRAAELIRVVDTKGHATLVDGKVRDVDFDISADLQWVEKNELKGLSFVTSMKKFKSLLKLKSRHVGQVDIYAVDESMVHIDGRKFIPDRPGHVSLVVSKRMSVSDLVKKLEALAKQMEPIGRMSRAAMKSLDPVVFKHIQHYAQYTNPVLISKISANGGVQDDVEAHALLDVLDAMYARIDGDSRQGTIVVREPVHVYDADKVAETVVAWLESLGYEHVTAARNY